VAGSDLGLLIISLVRIKEKSFHHPRPIRFTETAQVTEFRKGRKQLVGGAKPKLCVEVILLELL